MGCGSSSGKPPPTSAVAAPAKSTAAGENSNVALRAEAPNERSLADGAPSSDGEGVGDDGDNVRARAVRGKPSGSQPRGTAPVAARGAKSLAAGAKPRASGGAAPISAKRATAGGAAPRREPPVNMADGEADPLVALSRRRKPAPPIEYRPDKDAAFELYLAPGAPGAELSRMIAQKQALVKDTSAAFTAARVDGVVASPSSTGAGGAAARSHAARVADTNARAVDALEKKLLTSFEQWYDLTYGHLPARPPPGADAAATRIQSLVRGHLTRKRNVLARKRAEAERKREIAQRTGKLRPRVAVAAAGDSANEVGESSLRQSPSAASVSSVREPMPKGKAALAERIAADRAAAEAASCTFQPTTTKRSAALAAAARERRGDVGSGELFETLSRPKVRARRPVAVQPDRDAEFERFTTVGDGAETTSMIAAKRGLLRRMRADLANGPALAQSSHAIKTADTAAASLELLERKLLADFDTFFAREYGHLPRPIDAATAAEAHQAAVKIQALVRGRMARKRLEAQQARARSRARAQQTMSRGPSRTEHASERNDSANGHKAGSSCDDDGYERDANSAGEPTSVDARAASTSAGPAPMPKGKVALAERIAADRAAAEAAACTFKPETNKNSAALAAAARQRRGETGGDVFAQLSATAPRSKAVVYAPSRDDAFDSYITRGPGAETQRLLESKQALLGVKARELDALTSAVSSGGGGGASGRSERAAALRSVEGEVTRLDDAVAACERKLLTGFSAFYKREYGGLPRAPTPAATGNAATGMTDSVKLGSASAAASGARGTAAAQPSQASARGQNGDSRRDSGSGYSADGSDDGCGRDDDSEIGGGSASVGDGSRGDSCRSVSVEAK